MIDFNDLETTDEGDLGDGTEHRVLVGKTPFAEADFYQLPLDALRRFGAPKIEAFTTVGSHTWTKPANCQFVDLIIVGGGGAGASGAVRPTGTASLGGGGGCGGQVIKIQGISVSNFGSTVPIVVGAGGIGGASVVADNTTNTSGGAGGNSSFGPFVATAGAPALDRTGGLVGIRASNFYGSTILSGSGGAGSATGGAGSNGTSPAGSQPGGGGAGGGLTTANVAAIGGNGSVTNGALIFNGVSQADLVPLGGALGLPGANAVTSLVFSEGNLPMGGGGAGGGAALAAAGGAGGNAVNYGGGGGGGGASRNGFPSGAGGNGAQGFVLVISY